MRLLDRAANALPASVPGRTVGERSLVFQRYPKPANVRAGSKAMLPAPMSNTPPAKLPGRSFELLGGKALAPLKTADDLEPVARKRIALRPEHAHPAVRRLVRQFAKILESDSRVDVVAQYRLSGFGVTDEQALHALLQKHLANAGIALNSRPVQVVTAHCVCLLAGALIQ